MLLSGTDVGAVDGTTAVGGTTGDSAVDAASATDTNNGHHYQLPKIHKGFP